jgi:formate dehydrogenase iron-sulfur subunit
VTATHKPNDGRTLIDELLADQRELSAAARFARQHDHHGLPAQAKYYRDLIPLSAPRPGEQYAFEVDLDKCSGCKACVTACHNLNGLDSGETWRDVGLLFSDDWRAPFQATVTTACHHCVDPGCLSGCPVLAYDKDPVTGIVHHLDDQCIGCQYCVMKCPYEVPQYSVKRGIVRKCDMCSGRLSQGEAPACVQACPSQAIRITLVDQREISTGFRGHASASDSSSTPAINLFLPASPEPDYTVPTTRYKSARPLPASLLAGDHAHASPAHSHLPLVFMLVFSQLAVGASLAAVVMEPAKWSALIAFGVGMLALGLGTLHLGQPLKAWRAFLGWRTSWFSREVIAFGGFMPLAALTAVSFWLGPMTAIRSPLALITTAAGVLAVGCSAMIYADTRREFWRASQSIGKFAGTTLLLGSALTLVLTSFTRPVPGASFNLLVVMVWSASAVKLSFEHRIFQHLRFEEASAPTQLNRTAGLLAGELGIVARVRIFFGVAGGLVFPLLLGLDRAPGEAPASWLALAAFAFCVVGELLERYLFFTAVAPAKMPGGAAV